MSWGLETYGPNGETRLRQDKRLCRLLFRHVAPSNTNSSAYVDLTGVSNPTAVAIPLEGDAYRRHIGHRITFSPATGLITWRAFDVSVPSQLNEHAQTRSSDTLILVFGYG